MTKTTSMARTGLLAVLLAMVGFSYSLATSNSSATSSTSVPFAAVGSNPLTSVPLAFANPFVTNSTNRDLGDAVAGSALTRLVRAKGGVPPYAFTTAGTATSLLTTASLQLLNSGILTTIGSGVSSTPFGAGKGNSGPFIFAVTCKDSFGTNPHSVTEAFQLTFVTTNIFRFATTAVADGTQYQAYVGQLNTINGDRVNSAKAVVGPTYSIDPKFPLPTGLSVSNDGVVYGVPTVSGNLTFRAIAVDANGKPAASRDGSTTGQVYTIKIAKNGSLASVISAGTITVKTGFAKSKAGVGADGIAYKGVANLGATSIAALSGSNLTIRVGTYTSPATAFDGKGNAVTPKAKPATVPNIKGSVKKGGVLNIAITKESINFSTALTSQPATILLPVEVRVGTAAIGSESLTFTAKYGKTGATLTYKGDSASDTGGSGQLLGVVGSDDKKVVGDAWKALFLARFPTGLLGTSTVDSVDVAIGQSSINNASITTKGTKLTAKGSVKNGDPIIAFSLDNKQGKGSLTTGALLTTATGIPTAAVAATKTGVTTFFPLGLGFNSGKTPLFGITSSLFIVPNRTKWSSQ